MNKTTKGFIFWIPRVLGILFAVFLSMFALDVFNEDYSFGETILALLIHLIPTYLVTIALVIAWRRERIGAIFFIALGMFYAIASRGGSWVISGSLFLIGVLFLFGWIYKTQPKKR